MNTLIRAEARWRGIIKRNEVCLLRGGKKRINFKNNNFKQEENLTSNFYEKQDNLNNNNNISENNNNNISENNNININNLEKDINEKKIPNDLNGIPIKDDKIIEPEKIVRILNKNKHLYKIYK